MALDLLFEHVQSRLVGRRVDLLVGTGPLSFTLTGVDARLHSIGAAAGQADDVTLAAEDVEFGGLAVARVAAALGNVHTRVGPRPALVCAPVDLRIELTDEQVAAVVQRYVPRVVAGTVGADRVRLRLSRRLGWGWLDVRPVVARGRLVLAPVAIGRGRHEWPLTRLPSRTIPLDLPATTRLTGIAAKPALLVVELRLDQWRIDYAKILGQGG